MSSSKETFYANYRIELLNRYAWAQDAAKLDHFMASVRATMESSRSTWTHSGEAVTSAWRSCGGKGGPTLKALRALPQWPE